MKRRECLVLIMVAILFCLLAISVGAQEHILDESYTYEDGFTAKGVYTATCSCGGEDCAVNEERAPLFTVSGFSTFISGSTVKGISFGYKANVELIEEYERVNGVTVSYGVLLASARYYANNVTEKIVHENAKTHTHAVEIRLNYEETDELGNCEYDKYDVIFAGSVTETKDGSSKTTYFQPKLPTNLYSNKQYGDLYGINHDVIAKKQNDLMVWYEGKQIDGVDGGIKAGASNTVASETYVRVKPGDTIILPNASNVAFALYGYNYLNGSYKYSGYIDCNSALATGEENENWGSSYTFNENDLICVKGNEKNQQKIDFNDFYVRIVFKSLDGTALQSDDFADDVIYNLVEVPNNIAFVTFKNGDEISVKECYLDKPLGKLPTVELDGHVLAGWHVEGKPSEVYTSETSVTADVTLVPYFRKNYTEIKNVIEWSQGQIFDSTGASLPCDASRFITSSFIKVNEGDTISIPSGKGYKIVIYCYSDMYGTYIDGSVIDCNPSDTTSKVENWGYTYTFKNGTVLENGRVLDCENLYVRVAVRRDDGGSNSSVDIATVKQNIVFNVTADNYHLVLGGLEGTIDCDHLFGDWQVIQERTCLKDGTDVRECIFCGVREARYTQTPGHILVVTKEAVAPSCIADGCTEEVSCSVCGIVSKASQKLTDANAHKFNKLVTLTTAPTEASEGKGTFECITCGATREETIAKIVTIPITKDNVENITTEWYNPAVDNIWNVLDGNTNGGGLYGPGDDWFGNVGDTLTITLDREVTLKRFTMYTQGNSTFANVIFKDAKGNVTGTHGVEAAKYDPPQKQDILTNGNIKVKTIVIEITYIKWNSAYTFKVTEVEMEAVIKDARLPHTHVYDSFVKVITEPTCTSNGRSEYACFCGVTSQKAVPYIAHDYSVPVSGKEATCTTSGTQTYKCATCTRTTTKTVSALGHKYEKLVEYVIQPTSAQKGEAIFECLQCGMTSSKTLAALPLGKVEHLRVDRLTTSFALLRFNVYGETANYEVRYSREEITKDNIESAKKLNATIQGDKEYTARIPVYANLSNCFYIAIRPYIGENYGEFTTIRLGGDSLIPIDYHSGNVYHGELLNSFAKLFDEQDGDRSVIPSSRLPQLITDKNDSVLYNMNLSPIVDLEYSHYVSNAYLYYEEAGAEVVVRWSDTPLDPYSENSRWDGYYTVTVKQGWNEFKMNSTTRYIQVIFQDGQSPTEMLVYGYQNGGGDEIATEIGSLPTIGEMMGMCGFVAGGGGNTPIDSVMCTTVLREYHNFGWSYDSTVYPGKAAFFNNSWMGNFDNQYRDYRRAGINVIPCVQWNLKENIMSHQVDENNLPIKSNGGFVKGGFYDKMNAHTYFVYADSMFAFAARYGSNNSTELLNTLALHVRDTNNVGLNTLEWIELGNEPEGSWNGIHNYYSAYQLAALTSAAYDGHCRTMVSTETSKGYHLGLKNADPNLKAAMAGVSAVSNEYITALCYWMKANRQDGSVAFDAFNVHCYMTKGYELPNGVQMSVGASPEEANIVKTLSQLIAIRDKYYPEKEVWITEFGWDTNQSYATSTSSHAYSNEETGISYTGREVQAMWLTRTYLLLSAIGIDKATMYMCEDCGVEEESVGKYGTAGVIGYKYDENGKTVEFKKDSYYYLYTLKNTLGSYTFNQKIEAYEDDVYIYQYKTADGKTAYAVWRGTSDGSITEDYQLRIGSDSATIIESENGNVYGKKTDVKSDSLGYISIDITEKPIYILID